MTIPWLQFAEKNIEGITAFALRLLDHEGRINEQYIYQIVRRGENITLEHPERIRGQYLNGGIRIPGEITNSFCTLYEVGYFINALFLSGVVSALPLEDYKETDNRSSLAARIKKDICSLTDTNIEKLLRSPRIPIISWLTDDVEPYRFRKEMLWGVNQEASKKIIGKINKNDLGQEQTDEFYRLLWVDKDRKLADKAIKYAKNMSEAKMIQYYLALEDFLRLLNIELSQIPFYFFSSPYHEMLELGPEHEFLEFLIEIHSREALKRFSKITGLQYPVFIKIPCPQCGESSKKIISGRIKGENKRTVRLICSKREKTFRNEHGVGTRKIEGCGHAWEFQIPDKPEELFKFLEDKGFSLQIALANLLQVFKNTAISPVAHVICDLNIYYDRNMNIKVFSPYPGGYGSSARLFTSVMGVQLAFLKGLLANTSYGKIMAKKLLVRSPFMIIAHQSPTTLFDPRDIYQDILKEYNILVGPQDSSIWKVINDGMSPEEVITRSIDLTYYPAEKMLHDVRGIQLSGHE